MAESRLDFFTREPIGSGELLSERLARDPLSSDEALRLAIEIGTALNRAHGSGQVHGGLCPFCVVLAPKGIRLAGPTLSPADRAAYRSPEEVRGEPATPQSDIFAYGALLYELATGRRAFPGAGSDLARSILQTSPAPIMAKAVVYAAMEGVIASCLEKEPSKRRQRVQNAVIELKLAGRWMVGSCELAARTQLRQRLAPAAPRAHTVAAPPPQVLRDAPRINTYASFFQKRIWSIGIAMLALSATSVAAVLLLHQRPVAPVLQFAVTQPDNTTFPGMPAVSPDGRYLTFSAVGQEGKRMLWLRPLDALHATVIPGTEGASAPFWSPDSRHIAFFAGRSLNKVKIAGGAAPETICPAEAAPGGGAWNKDGAILFSPGLSDAFYTVPAAGGKPRQVLKLDQARLERGDLWPQFLPDGKHFVFYLQTDLVESSGVYAGSIESKEYHRLFASQTNAVYSAINPDAPKSGYLLYINERNLMAQQFNAGSLEIVDAPITLGKEIGALRSLALAPISVSNNGVLVYQGVGKPVHQIVWMDRAGRQLAAAGEPSEYGPPRISPNGDRAALAKIDSAGDIAHLWLADLSGAMTQLSDGPVHEGAPNWSPDGSRLVYFAKDHEAYDLYQRPAVPGGKAELLYKSATVKFPTDWSHDGKYVFFYQTGTGTRLDVWGLSLADKHAAPILDTVYMEGFATLSPNGKWLAYQLAEGELNEVYVQAFDGLTSGTRKRWQISKGGGGLPRWRADSSELFYMTSDGRMMAASIRESGDEIQSGAPQKLFQTRPLPGTWNLYDVSPDGQRFIVNLPHEWTSAAPITVVTNWTELLKD